jgi:acyl CoA:acetate/3-ketoacid CoA transferase beta subunit
MTHDAQIDEIMVSCIARQICDGEVIVQGLATPIVAAGFMLARALHAPNLYFASAIGQGICRDPAPLGLTNVEKLWLDRSLITIGFVRVAADVLPSLMPKEFFRPAQVDPYGNTNNIAFGKSYLESELKQPRLRLPGSGGIPDVTTFIHKIYLYVPHHSRVTFVQKLDVRSGLGHATERRLGSGPIYLVSDMGQFDFLNGRLRLTSIHPGISVSHVQARTGFELEIAPDIHETPSPTSDELQLLRDVIDPLGIRRLELLNGNARRALISEILEVETLPAFSGI